MKELSLNNCRLDKRYDIREQLGRGSYAEVFLARDVLASPQSPHSLVVIKALNVFLQDDLDADLERTLVENFQNEAIALDRVRHPNIISRIGHGTARDLRGTVFHYLVLEYLAAGDLQSLLRREKVPLEQALKYIEQICAGLGHAHRYAIIHRDIKPQNLLLTADLWTIKIADFGVARVTASDSPITRVGTNIYAPPEHSPMSAGQAGTLAFAKLTPAADIYSLAKSVYTLLTGEAPRAYANETITGVPESVSGQEWSDELIRVLTRATNGDPRERHQTVEEFWGDLSGIREMAGDGEFSTVVASAIDAPQPHVSRGYTPIAPERPSFEAIAETPSSMPPLLSYMRPAYTNPVETPFVFQESKIVETKPVIYEQAAMVKRKSRTFRRFATFLLIIGLFTGILYGTASYMRGRSIFPEIRNPFRAQTGVANTDIYLRPSPNTENDPIGLVTKNSKVRIVNSQNNWYQVDVVEQGRDRPPQGNATRGWLNGKYLDIGSN
ncbi:MAG: serine/threonine protein kinase [Pyrinomonadaceae bacterium]